MLKLQYFGHLMQRDDSLEKTLMLGKIEGKRRRGQQRIRWLDDISHSVDLSLSKLGEIVKGREAWSVAVHGVAKSQRCYPTISSSVIPFSSCPQSFPASGSFPTSWLFASGGQSIGASATVLPKYISRLISLRFDWFDLLKLKKKKDKR